MLNQIPKGFISKKQATARYNRSSRQLTRDITEAITLIREDVLPHLILKTDDGDFHEGSTVTLGGIKEMKSSGLNPMWFVEEVWMRDSFGIRNSDSNQKPKPEPEPSEKDPSPATNTNSKYSDDYVQLLVELNSELKKDKDKLLNLVEELTENQKQNNVLTQDLHKLIAGQQEAKQEKGTKAAQIPVNPQPVIVVEESKPKTTKTSTPKKAKAKGKAKERKKSIFETATPTFYKIFTK